MHEEELLNVFANIVNIGAMRKLTISFLKMYTEEKFESNKQRSRRNGMKRRPLSIKVFK